MTRTLRTSLPYVAGIVGLFFFLFTNSAAVPEGLIHESIEGVGIVLIVFCIIGRNWVSVYRNDTHDFLTMGPYSIVRNPRDAFAVVGFAGIGAQLGSVSMALICGASAFLAFSLILRSEEEAKLRRYGAPYQRYLERVPCLIPDKTLWTCEDTISITPPRFFVMFFEAIGFLLPIPLAELCESLQALGILPVLFVLP